ncbi:MAG: SCO family protein [Bryobacterales bacterium]|nr:SCO family protein [Bryobacterales bacterium]
MKSFGLIVMSLAVILLMASCSRAQKADRLPVLGQVEDFTLTNQDGQPFGMNDLNGRIWVADFFFSNCPGPCPRMSSLMGDIQRLTRDIEELRIVSITVDPERDTPEAMKAYGKRYGAIDGRWHFLTGPQELLHRLASKDFGLFDVDGSLQHSTRFALIDRQGRVRGLYSTGENGSYARIPEDARRLLAE